MSALVLFLYLGEKYLTEMKTITRVTMIQIIMMIMTTGIIMRIGSAILVVVIVSVVVVLVSDSDVMGGGVVFRMLSGGQVRLARSPQQGAPRWMLG